MKLFDRIIAVVTAALFFSVWRGRFDGRGKSEREPLLTGKADSLERGTAFWQLNLYKSLQRREPKPKPYAIEIARKGKWTEWITG